MEFWLIVFLAVCPTCGSIVVLIGIVGFLVYRTIKKNGKPEIEVRVGSFGSSDDFLS